MLRQIWVVVDTAVFALNTGQNEGASWNETLVWWQILMLIALGGTFPHTGNLDGGYALQCTHLHVLHF